MPKPQCLALDTRDDRRELHYLLDKLAPRERVRFVRWCCTLVTGPHGDKVRVKAGTTYENSIECFLELHQLAVMYDLDIDKVARRLERLVARR